MPEQLLIGTRSRLDVPVVTGEPTLATTGPRVSLAGAGPTLTPTWAGTETVINVGDVWTTKIAAGSTGTVFRVKAGVHRRTALGCRPKAGQQFIGEPGAIVTGAVDVVGGSGWTLTSGVYSKTDASWPAASDAGVGPGGFIDGYTESHWREDLVFDPGAGGQSIKQRVAGSTPAAGQWAYNSSTKTIYLGDNPAGHAVEVSFDQGTSNNDFAGSGGERVVLRNLTIRHYPTNNQQAAIDTQGSGGGVGATGTYPMFSAANGYDYTGTTPEGNTSGTLGGWLIDHCALTLCHSFAIYAGPGTVVQDCDISINGQGGGKGAGRNVVYQRCAVNSNNYTHYDVGVEAGGMKLWNVMNSRVSDCSFKTNRGCGAWWDYTWNGHLIEYSTFEDNLTPGIVFEQTEGAEVSHCQVLGNNQNLYQRGMSYAANSPGGQIFIGTTRNAHVHHNYIDTKTTGWGAVSYQEQERGGVAPWAQGTGALAPVGSPFAGMRACCTGSLVEYNSTTVRSMDNGNAVLWYAQNAQDYTPYSDVPPGKAVGWVKATHTDYGASSDVVYTRTIDYNWYHLPNTGNNADSLLHDQSGPGGNTYARFPFRWDGEYGTQLITGTPEAYSTTNIYNIIDSDGRRFGSFAQWQTALSTPGTSGGGFGQDAHSTVFLDQ